MTVKWNEKAVADAIRSAAQRGAIKAAEVVRKEALRLIQETPKTGRTYTRAGVIHVASAPGEPPASDQGTLVGRIQTRSDMAPLWVRTYVQAATAYARALEYGTPKMLPRPFMRLALSNKTKTVNNIIRTSIVQAVRKITGRQLVVQVVSAAAQEADGDDGGDVGDLGDAGGTE